MPNWVYNNLTVTPNEEAGGTVKDVAALVEQVGKPFTVQVKNFRDGETQTHTVEGPFMFWNIDHPEGEDLEKYDQSLIDGGAMPFWYDWNCEHWGTKWDTNGEVGFTDHGPDHKQYSFETAWAPPLEALTTLSAQHPNLHIELEWEEEQGFGGTFVFREGNAHETLYYDVPSSHADYVEREKECACEIWQQDDPPFEDCPGYVPESCYIESDELEVESMV